MLEVREQVPLPAKRLLDICLDSISYRLLRSMVTVVIILLAIAFLGAIMIEGYMGRSVRDTVVARTKEKAAYGRFISSISQVDADEKLVSQFANLHEDSADYQNLAQWGAFPKVQAKEFVEQSKRVELYLNFLQAIPLGRRVLLVGQKSGLGIFDWLSEPERFRSFKDSLANLKSIRLPGDAGAFDAFVQGWPEYRKELERIKKSYRDTIQRTAESCGPAGVSGKLKEVIASGKVDGFFEQLGQLGYHVEKQDVPAIVEGAKFQDDLDWAYSHLNQEAVRTNWNRKYEERFSQGAALRSCATDSGRVKWIQETLAQKGDKELGEFDPARFRKVAQEYRQKRILEEQEQSLVTRYGQSQTLSGKTIWLICVSFMVCVVGIANAMLMSVLERFKEIATMKCLGARNSTIAFLFVTESVIIGVVGGLAGIILGFLIVLVRMLISYGGLVFAKFAGTDMLLAFVICFLCSLLLATVAAIYPAWVASRMAPMDAMRVD
jgi:hypothetical protein